MCCCLAVESDKTGGKIALEDKYFKDTEIVSDF